MERWANFEAREHDLLARQIRHNLWLITAMTAIGMLRAGLRWEEHGWALLPLAGAVAVLVAATRLDLSRFATPAYAAAVLGAAAFCLADPDGVVIAAVGGIAMVTIASTTAGTRASLGIGALAVACFLGVDAIHPIGKPLLMLSLTTTMLVVVALAGLTASNRSLRREQRDEVAYRMNALLSNGYDAILAVGPDGVGYASVSARRMLGRETGDITLDDLAGLIHPEDVVRVGSFIDGLREGEPGRTDRIESRCKQDGGHYLDVEVAGTNHLRDPRIGAIVLTFRDVSTQNALRGELTRTTFEDPITRLPNRALLRDRIGTAARRHSRTGGRISLLFIDLDEFKKVNDTLGHMAGDEMLRIQARRMAATVRPGDTLARLGGDEFAVLVEDLDDLGLHALAGRLLDAVREPITLGDTTLTGSASIGIATVKADQGSDIDLTDELMRDADLAMYVAKEGGRDRAVPFEASMYAAAVAEAEARADLERGLRDGEFVVFYQPIVDLPSGRPIGVEALVRWEHPVRGLLGPDTFIAHAERTGLIVPLGEHVLRTACAEVARWHAKIPGGDAIRVSVNLSVRQMHEPGLLDTVRDALATTGINPAKVVLEITESMLMDDVDATVVTLHRLRELGVRLAIDDFGTGYSSLSYLSRFPIDILKIDKAFVDGITTNREDAALAEAVVGLGRALRLQTVAEGIEQPGQQSLLSELGCTYGQGYLFSRPAAAADITAWLASASAGSASSADVDQAV